MSNIFRKEAVEHQHMSLYGEVIISQPTPYYFISVFMFVLVLFLGVVLYWGIYTKKETTTGYLALTTGFSKIYPKRNGIVNQVMVSDGQRIVKGQKLIYISTKKESEDALDIDGKIINELENTLLGIIKKKNLEKQLAKLEIKRLQSVSINIKKNISHNQKQLTYLSEKVLRSDKKLHDTDGLHKKGLLSTNEFDKEKELNIDKHLELNRFQIEIEKLKLRYTEINNQLNKTPLLLSSKLTNLQSDTSNINQEIIKLKNDQGYFLRSSITGKITALQVKNGQYVYINTPLMVVIPENSLLEAIMLIPTKSIGLIRKNQIVKIRYSAFPYQRYGIFNGTIDKISKVILNPDEIQFPTSVKEPVYRVTVKIANQSINSHNQKFPLQAGMSFEADIVLENLSFFDWVFEPLLKFKGKLK